MDGGGAAPVPTFAHAAVIAASTPARRTSLSVATTSLRRLQSRCLDRRQYLGRLEEIRSAIHHLHELHGTSLVDDEVGALGVAIDWTGLVHFHRAVRGKHLPAKIREEELLGL